MRSGDLAGVISDCYQRARPQGDDQLLDNMMQMGFRESTNVAAFRSPPTTWSPPTQGQQCHQERREGGHEAEEARMTAA